MQAWRVPHFRHKAAKLPNGMAIYKEVYVSINISTIYHLGSKLNIDSVTDQVSVTSNKEF
jgi:hypothetical protein